MDRLTSMSVFTEVTDLGSFAVAATELRLADAGWLLGVCVPIPTLRLKTRLRVAFLTDKSNPFRSTCSYRNQSSAGEAKMDRSLITDLPRDKHVMRCKQRALAYLD